jgi:OOP family OmpA-OmpF porin
MRRCAYPGALLVLVALAVASAAPAFAQDARVDAEAPCYRWPAVDYDNDGIYDRVDNCPGTPAGCVVDQWGCSVDSDGDGICDGRDKCSNTPMNADVDPDGCSESQLAAMRRTATPPPPPPPPPPAPAPPPPPPAPAIASGPVVLEGLEFDTGKATLKQSAKDRLQQACEGMRRYPELRVEISGYTDTSGPAANNMTLSMARANAVKDFMVNDCGIDASRMTTKGYGETNPIVSPDDTPEKRARNRRIEFRALNPEVLPRGVEVKTSN